MSRPTLFAVALVAWAFFLTAAATAQEVTKGEPVPPFTANFKKGQYVWHPEISPAGPVVIIVSLPEQVLYVYRNGVRIGRSTISSSKSGHNTPVGVFSVLQKAEVHHSSIYKGAPMPYMERLTWSGVALHAGNLPGYPASHGCVRMPLDFARMLYSITGNDTMVIVTDLKSAPGTTISSPGALFTAAPREVTPAGAVVWKPEQQPTGPVSIIVSSSAGMVYVFRNGAEIGRAPVYHLNPVKGSYVYSATNETDSAGRRTWLATASLGGEPPDIRELAGKVSIDKPFLLQVRALITPGTTLILTDFAVDISTLSKPGFSILTSGSSGITQMGIRLQVC